MKKILVDTDILIDYSKGYDRRLGTFLTKQEHGEAELFVTPVTIAEFMTDNSLHNKKKRHLAEAFLSLFTVREIGKSAGMLAGQFLREGKTDFLGDALIAGVAVDAGLTLATSNTHHFRSIPGIVLV